MAALPRGSAAALLRLNVSDSSSSSVSIEQLCLPAEAHLKLALERLQATGTGMLLLVDAQGRLLRTVSDGDVRRLLLAGHTLESRLQHLPAQAPRVISSTTTSSEALVRMNDWKVDHLPVIDAQQRPVRLLTRRELDASILLSTPHMGEHEMAYVEEAFRSNWIAPLGPNVDAFEKELAAYVDVQHAAALSSGTAAIHLALRLLNVGPGDRVLCSSFTFVASTNPILYQGAEPVLIDSEPDTWNMSPSALERALAESKQQGRLPKAVIVVNLYGQSADLDPLLQLCHHYGVPLIEDAAESLGATYKGRASGTLGVLGAYSFNGNKIITTSGGGMLVSNDEALIRRARFLSTQAKESAPHYEHVEVGYNYRMSNVLAGIGRGQLRVIEERIEARQNVYRNYVAGLKDVSAIEWMPEPTFGRCTHWLSACTLTPKLDTHAFMQALAAEQIEARRVWKPMHMQPLFKDAAYYPHQPDQDVSRRLFQHGLCLPSGSNLSPEQQERAIEAIRRLAR